MSRREPRRTPEPAYNVVGDKIGDDREQLYARLTAARQARVNLPARVVHPDELAEVRIPIPDRAGAAAEVFTLAAERSERGRL